MASIDREMKNIYTMSLHERYEYDAGDNYKKSITRVPGGWIYVFLVYVGSNISISSTFVPFTIDNEFVDIDESK
jgi:hypothetical protein